MTVNLTDDYILKKRTGHKKYKENVRVFHQRTATCIKKYFILLFDAAKYKFVFSKYKNNYQVTKSNIS